MRFYQVLAHLHPIMLRQKYCFFLLIILKSESDRQIVVNYRVNKGEYPTTTVNFKKHTKSNIYINLFYAN